jgi:hypothetical protein
MIVFQRERVRDVWDEIYPLAKKHSEGSQSYRRHEPFRPSKERYMHYDAVDFFHLLTGRDEGTLAGYFGIYVTNSMHSQLLMVTEDTFFLDIPYRGGRTALRFMQALERYIVEMARAVAPDQTDIEILFSCEQDNATGIHKLLNMLDYNAGIVQYTKRLPLHPGADSAASSKRRLCERLPAMSSH